MQSTPLPALPYQVWNLISKDYELRLALVANNFAQEYQNAKGLLLSDKRSRGNSAYLGPAWVDLIINDADKRAEWAFKACCDIWEIQGHTQSKVFFRAIFECCLEPLFGVRVSCFKSDIDLYRRRTKRQFAQQDSALLGHLNREVDHLRSKWNTKLEIAARDAEHRQRLTQIQVAQGAMMKESEAISKANANLKARPSVIGEEPRLTWETLESRFNSIQVNAPSTERVMVEYGWEAQNTDPATSTFHLRGNAIFLSEFKSLANIAGQKLGCTGNVDECIKTWLDSVFSMVLRDGYLKYELYISRLIGDGKAPGKEYVSEYYRSEQISKLSALLCLVMQGKTVQMNAEIEDVQKLVSRTESLASKKRPQRYKQESYFEALRLLKSNPTMTTHDFCLSMDRQREQHPTSAKYSPPKRWKVRSFIDQFNKRENTVTVFLSRLRKENGLKPD